MKRRHLRRQQELLLLRRYKSSRRVPCRIRGCRHSKHDKVLGSQDEAALEKSGGDSRVQRSCGGLGRGFSVVCGGVRGRGGGAVSVGSLDSSHVKLEGLVQTLRPHVVRRHVLVVLEPVSAVGTYVRPA